MGNERGGKGQQQVIREWEQVWREGAWPRVIRSNWESCRSGMTLHNKLIYPKIVYYIDKKFAGPLKQGKSMSSTIERRGEEAR